MIRVVVSGSGQMGRVVVEAVEAEADMEVVGVIEPMADPADFRATSGTVYGTHANPSELFAATHPDVVVDFTNAKWTPRLAEAAMAAGVRPVIGTSGVPADTVELLRAGCASKGIGGVVASNFALGAVVLMHLSTIAARYFDTAEVIELHHDRKVDSPSGTALQTARMMREARGRDFMHQTSQLEHVPGAQGALEGGVGMHSVRLPGFVASQEVIFGGQGQWLTLRHDTSGRDCYKPGIVLAVREVMQRNALVVGLDELIGLK
ncbi:MAG: 4-hydroxy-tetrahydrodipicolinate reductase [Dehalococcoidia bacterium]|nr:4-hydroxy-tetrahydrodipicolinate reductase [Dehalococcoidia bacterium]